MKTKRGGGNIWNRIRFFSCIRRTRKKYPSSSNNDLIYACKAGQIAKNQVKRLAKRLAKGTKKKKTKKPNNNNKYKETKEEREEREEARKKAREEARKKAIKEEDELRGERDNVNTLLKKAFPYSNIEEWRASNSELEAYNDSKPRYYFKFHMQNGTEAYYNILTDHMSRELPSSRIPVDNLESIPDEIQEIEKMQRDTVNEILHRCYSKNAINENRKDKKNEKIWNRFTGSDNKTYYYNTFHDIIVKRLLLGENNNNLDPLDCAVLNN